LTRWKRIELMRPVQLIQPEDVLRRRAEGKPFRLIDVRTPAEFAAVHAQGATLVPLDALSSDAVISGGVGGDARASDQPIYLICASGARATKAVETLEASGLTNLFCVAGGTSAWERAGLPVVRGTARVVSLERQVRIAAGSLVLTGLLLGWLVHPALFGLAAFVGAGLIFAGVTDFCGMGMLLARMPWNRRAVSSEAPVVAAVGGGGERGGHESVSAMVANGHHPPA